ncbi:hypothetical protein AMECASPLE_036846 [Ameca splendens]|uniref:Uncharacterized protein n=1 Tax=Ameca splendens TaxID=208324 RepID=A0ABV1AE64_9TELE
MVASTPLRSQNIYTAHQKKAQRASTQPSEFVSTHSSQEVQSRRTGLASHLLPSSCHSAVAWWIQALFGTKASYVPGGHLLQAEFFLSFFFTQQVSSHNDSGLSHLLLPRLFRVVRDKSG